MEVDKLSVGDEGRKDENVLLPGFRFHPTDEELVGFYLRRKVERKPLSIELIKHIDVYKYDPWDLPKVGTVGEKERYFFCIRERKYKNSVRPNRVTGSGFWKATGIDKSIYSHAHDCIGLKKSLVYYIGSSGKGSKTDWMMHEFRLPVCSKTSNITLEAEIWTLCRIFKRTVTYKKYTPSRRGTPSDSSSQTCSLESINVENKISVEVFSNVDQQKEKKQLDESNYLFSSFPNLVNSNWDELRPMVAFTSDPDFNLY
ncbi:hypothetical protein GIB67_031937 [Kingdonia uniflora]|uniref:NAC domain-containing protein n=1 Tax=Kingdonia uniflora TaxID=39325 RepID=A0A7J7NTP6_9MAGN|nr:hypothetical protein GIB67_031937 [Kingdonia uniflora]